MRDTAATHVFKKRPSLKFAPPSAFARDLQARLAAYNAETGRSRHADRSQWLHTLAIGGLGAALYSLLLLAGAAGPAWLSVALTVGTAFCCFMLLVLIGHDAAHGSASPRRWANEATLFLVFAIQGVSGALWRDRHLRLHHCFPNLPGTGIDADASNVVRLAPDKPRCARHRFQPVYGVALYALGLALLAWVEDFQMFREARRTRPSQFGGARPLTAFAASKLIHVALFIVLPAAIGGFGPPQIAIGYLLATATISLAFAALVIGTHVSDLAEFPMPDEDGRLAHDWATHQVVTSVDWAPTSRLAAALTGGANAHTAHHLFPSYSHGHSAALARIVIEAAAEHGLPYRPTSFVELVGGHLRHLRAMGST